VEEVDLEDERSEGPRDRIRGAGADQRRGYRPLPDRDADQERFRPGRIEEDGGGEERRRGPGEHGRVAPLRTDLVEEQAQGGRHEARAMTLCWSRRGNGRRARNVRVIRKKRASPNRSRWGIPGPRGQW
jgi:hypothetical protein